MMQPVYVLNLSNAPQIDVSEFVPVGSAVLSNVGELAYLPKQPLILYIVAHGVPDGIVVDEQTNQIIEDTRLAAAIKEARAGVPTLCIWDLCFAESMGNGPNLRWDDNFVHLFSCRSYERSWFVRPGDARRSNFASALNKVVARYASSSDLDWVTLVSELRLQLEPVQCPTSLVPQRAPLSAAQFLT